MATAAGCIPGVVFAGAPPLGVAVTGLLFVPGSYRLLNRLYWQESETLIELERAQVSNDRVETFDRCKGLVLHQNLPPAQRASALTFLLRNYERAEVATLLNEVMERGPKLLILQALHACTEITHRPPIELLVRIAKRNDVLLTPIAIKLIGLSGGTNAEGVLLDLLASPSIMARRAVVDAIARVGTRRSIEPIRAVIHRPTRDRVLEVAAEEAILRIQRRLGPSRPGALSLVAHTRDVGAVSLSDDKQGGISVTEEGKVQ